jgi:hypothetical protein
LQVTFEINGRQALPVRAIPLLTDWRGLSPDQLAQILAGDSDHWPSFDGLTAHRLNPDGSTELIPPRRWASWTVRKLKAISEAIKATQVGHETGYQQWRSESLAQLPAGVFVWRDEFEKAYVHEYGPESLRSRFNPETFDPSAYALDFNPQPDPAIAPPQLVMEGFTYRVDAGAKVLTEQEAAEQAVGWWDATMDAAGFFALGRVLPVEAAMLLCSHNPHERTEQDAEVITCEPNTPDQITPDDFKRLRRTFVDLDHTKPGNRSLVDWMRAAVEAGRRVHPWAYEYAKHCGLWPSTEPTPVGHPLNEAATPAESVPVQPEKEKPAERRARWLAMFEEEEQRARRGALQRLADREGADRSNMRKAIAKAREERDTQRRAGTWAAQLVQNGKRAN